MAQLSAGYQAFSCPDTYRRMLINSEIAPRAPELTGKTFICVSLTRFCPVMCEFCFFKSAPVYKKPTIEDDMDVEGTEKFIRFANEINLGYLLVSGGGEPMMQRKSVMQIVEKVESERIVFVTSANWAKNYKTAKAYVDEMALALNRRKTQTSVTIRVSIDKEHTRTLGLDPALNLIRIFVEDYKNHSQLDLQFHSLIGDDTIDEITQKISDSYRVTRTSVEELRVSDGKSVMKIVPKKENLEIAGYQTSIGYAKTFFSDLKVDLRHLGPIEKNIQVYQKDLYESEDGNSSIVTNKLGEPGLDFWVNYNGNVTTWGNQLPDNLFNVYEDNSKTVIRETLKDPAALSFIEKGADYRDRIVSEVNPVAVLRSKAVNIRDYTGALLFDEARTRLYYTIRSLQDYISEGRISAKRFEELRPELRELLEIKPEQLAIAYHQATRNIVDQLILEAFSKDKILDYMQWIHLGHYQLDSSDIERLLAYYNRCVSVQERLSSIADAKPTERLQIARMTEYLTHIKPTLKVEQARPRQLPKKLVSNQRVLELA